MSGVESARRAAARIRSAASRDTLRSAVLLYHRVVDVTGRRTNAVSTVNFSAQLEVLASLGTTVALDEVRRRTGSIAITFDDGYVDNLTNAEPLLDRHDLPATLFSAPLHEPWWSDLEWALTLAPAVQPVLRLRLGDTEIERSVPSDSAGRSRLAWELRDRLRVLPAEGRREAAAELRAWATTPDPDPPRPLSRNELAAVADRGVFALGGHTHTHPVLASLDANAQYREIADGRRVLEEITGRRLADFAYPYGGRSDYNRATLRAVRASGFERAWVADADCVRPQSHPLRLPRFLVGDWDGETFERNVRAWLGWTR